MCTRSMVTVFTADGAIVGFFGTSVKVADPRSLKIVGHGVAAEHGAGEMRFVTTSDSRTLLAVPLRGPPDGEAVKETMAIETGARPVRAASPHEAAAAVIAARVRIRRLT